MTDVFSYCLFLSPILWTFTVSNDLRACSSALFVMAERTPVVKKYRDALENVIGATMEFLARAPTAPVQEHPSPDQTQSLTTPQQTSHTDTGALPAFSSSFTSAAQESYVRDSPKVAKATLHHEVSASTPALPGIEEHHDVFGYMPDTQTSPGAEGRWEGRQGEMGQMDAEWMLSLCEGDGFSLQMLNEMMRFEPSLGA